MLAMDMAHIILFVVDGKSGLTAADREVAQILRKTKKPVILVVNKIDSQSQLIANDISLLPLRINPLLKSSRCNDEPRNNIIN